MRAPEKHKISREFVDWSKRQKIMPFVAVIPHIMW